MILAQVGDDVLTGIKDRALQEVDTHASSHTHGYDIHLSHTIIEMMGFYRTPIARFNFVYIIKNLLNLMHS